MEVKNVEKKEKNSALITVSVSPEEFEAAVVKVYNRNRKSIQIPGFRKGKAPRKIVEAMYGRTCSMRRPSMTWLPRPITSP